jgi:hypothetical protein
MMVAMTITPDDLPPDSPVSQVVCACLSEVFRFVITDTDVRAVCPACGLTAGTWPAAGGAHQARTEADPVPGLQVGSGWGGEEAPLGPGPADQEITRVYGGSPPLPAFGAGNCDAYLEGGPYDGQTTFTMGADPFIIRGVGSYRRRAGWQRDGRNVYGWAGPAVIQ